MHRTYNPSQNKAPRNLRTPPSSMCNRLLAVSFLNKILSFPTPDSNQFRQFLFSSIPNVSRYINIKKKNRGVLQWVSSRPHLPIISGHVLQQARPQPLVSPYALKLRMLASRALGPFLGVLRDHDYQWVWSKWGVQYSTSIMEDRALAIVCHECQRGHPYWAKL